MIRKIKYAVLTLSAVSGFGAALTIKGSQHQFSGATYYCIGTTGTHFIWSKYRPKSSLGLECVQTSILTYCTIVTRGTRGGKSAFSPVADTIPSKDDADRIGPSNYLNK